MGGMQFQTEHHLFPQIPFYRIPDAVPIIKEELAKLGKSLIYGPVIGKNWEKIDNDLFYSLKIN